MRGSHTLLLVPGILAAWPLLAFRSFTQDPSPAGTLDYAGLKAMVQGMGHAIQDVSESKFEVKIDHSDYQVPVAFEVSGSGRYVWLTAYFGTVPEGGLPAEQANAMLRRNAEIQPSHFYLTDKNGLMLALPVENRAVDAAVMLRCLNKICDDVVNSAELWSDR